ncbi:uncharacterized protein LOC113329473 isoform X2 [Papaver somniferum]|uniref:uncharacterized protein LOC113329473 isoform X2 n=1 Tax=Papaver somniferum TaxID=3469 RepID=UPI000E702E97|nr:uncharacterized protein LOC113329473 isoform X2 [Papaver somniferum]
MMLKFIELICWIFILTTSLKEVLVEGRTIPKMVKKAIIKTIKIRPSFYTEGTKSNNLGILRLTQTWHKYGSCPEGTIPIRRKGKNYNPTLLRKHHSPRSSPYKTLVTSQISKDIIDDYMFREYATIGVQGNFLGGKAKINLWKPFTEKNEISLSQIWVAAGEYQDLNTIEVGWHVYQDIYGDDQTRFFIYWTTDGYLSSGCYNLLCDGFVHTSTNISLGCNFTEVSTFNGDQKDATFSIRKDQSSGHWWVQVQGIPVGYYPGNLFTKLSKTATSVEWGGEIANRKSKGRHTSTQMGSGHFPSEGGLKTSSYFNWVQVFDESNKIKDPENVGKRVTHPNCYGLKIDSDHYGTNGYGFYYGGPGYNSKCQ